MRITKHPVVLLAAAVLLTAAIAVPAAGDDELVRLSVVFTNDIHGGIDRSGATFMNREFPPPLGGAASAVASVCAATPQDVSQSLLGRESCIVSVTMVQDSL